MTPAAGSGLMPTSRGVLERAREFIRAELQDGAKLRSSIMKAAGAAGFNEKNIGMAARQLGVVADRVQVRGIGWRARWQMPETATPAPAYPIDPPPDPTRPPAVTDDQMPSVSALFAELQKLPKNVDIYRHLDGEPAYLDSMASTDLTLRTLKRRYGGGRYTVEGMTFVVEGPPLSADSEPTQSRPRGGSASSSALPAPSAGGGLNITELFLAMMQQQGAILTALISNRGGADPVQMFKAVDDALDRRLQAMGGSRGPAQPIDEALKLLREGMALGRESEGDGEGDGFGRAINAIAPFLNTLASRLAPASQPTTAGAPALPAGTTAPAGSAAAPASEGIPLTQLQLVVADLTPILPDLCQQAKQGTDVKQVADYILKNATDEQYDALAGAAESPQFVADLIADVAKRIPPQSAFALPWLRTLADRLNDLLAEDRAGSPDSDGTS
jgi:hypothetical protein